MQYSKLEDKNLVAMTLAGETDAYEALVIRYQSAVIRSASSAIHNRSIAEDAAQDAFVSAWMKLDTLTDHEKFAPWVCRIAKNCAVNMLRQYQSYLTYDSVDRCDVSSDLTPELLHTKSDDRDELHSTLRRLPEKVGKIIHMYYFEELSIVEIADRMKISTGTVKSQLHDGRKRIRKELCAMDEKWNDTLVEKVMKKVEELKVWDLRKSKEGFDTVYKDVLADVEELPESDKKYHALADVLLRGWWWIKGEKNDALLSRIKEAAEMGKNDDVIDFICTKELGNIPYYDNGAKLDYIRDKQIPYLERLGLTKALALRYYWYAFHLYRLEKLDEGKAACEKVKSLLAPSELYHALAVNLNRIEEKNAGEYKGKDDNKSFVLASAADKLLLSGKTLTNRGSEETTKCYCRSVNAGIYKPFFLASECDGKMFDSSLSVGESIVGSDGATLTFASKSESVSTPAGEFDNCELWVTRRIISKREGGFKSKLSAYYKEGVGIVKYVYTNSCMTDTVLLSSYSVKGTGLLPLEVGNKWIYNIDADPAKLKNTIECAVTYFDGSEATVATYAEIARISYDRNSWSDMIREIRCDYWKEVDGNIKISDVSDAIMRANELAVTPYEKAHARVSASVAKRIMETDLGFNPDRTEEGIWNFFQLLGTHRKNGKVLMSEYFNNNFEWKNVQSGADGVLCNHIYGILSDAANCLFTDEWQIGADSSVEFDYYNNTVKTVIKCLDGGTVTTKAGEFENTMKVRFEISGMVDRFSYRGGNKDYYFAPGVGIVKVVNNTEFSKEYVYELTSYTGTGEGYMPLEDGFTRKYESVDLTDGFYGSAEYTYVKDSDGDIIILEDNTGIRKPLPKITSYSTIEDEITEGKLWNEGKHDESRLAHDVNNFKLLIHFIGRENRYWAAPEKCAAWRKYVIGIIEHLSPDTKVPDAWKGMYYRLHFGVACNLIGCGKIEEGYEYLERAIELYPAWNEIPDGAELEVGDPLIYGGIKYVKGKDYVVLPDGRKVGIDNEYMFNPTASNMYYGMTATSGWEWFDPARNEEKYKDYVRRIKALADAENK